MPLVNPLFGHSGKPTFADARRDLEGTVVRSATGVMRAGVFPDHLNPLVTGQSSMRVAIAEFRAVQTRGGAVFLANVGVDTSVILDAAPAANRRIDLIYATMRSTTLGDTEDTPTFGIVKGVAAATPTVPPLPASVSTAIPLATVEIPAGATTTQSAGVIITQVYPYTAMAGGIVYVRNQSELKAWTPAAGGAAFNIAENATYLRGPAGWVSSSPVHGVISPQSGVNLTNVSVLKLHGYVEVSFQAAMAVGNVASSQVLGKISEGFLPEAVWVLPATGLAAGTDASHVRIGTDGQLSYIGNAKASVHVFVKFKMKPETS